MRTQIEYMRAEQSRKRSFAVRNDYKRDGAYTLISLYLTYFLLVVYSPKFPQIGISYGSCSPAPPRRTPPPPQFRGLHTRLQMSDVDDPSGKSLGVRREAHGQYFLVRPDTVSPDVLQVYNLASSAAYAITHASSPPTTGSAVLQGLVRAMGSRTTRWMTFLLALALACPIPHPLDRASGVCICTAGTSAHVPTLLVRPAGGLREAVCQPGRAKHSTCAFRVWKGVSLVGLPPVVNASLVEYRAP